MELFVFNGKKSDSIMLTLVQGGSTIVKAYAKNAVMMFIFLPV